MQRGTRGGIPTEEEAESTHPQKIKPHTHTPFLFVSRPKRRKKALQGLTLVRGSAACLSPASFRRQRFLTATRTNHPTRHAETLQKSNTQVGKKRERAAWKRGEEGGLDSSFRAPLVFFFFCPLSALVIYFVFFSLSTFASFTMAR